VQNYVVQLASESCVKFPKLFKSFLLAVWIIEWTLGVASEIMLEH